MAPGKHKRRDGFILKCKKKIKKRKPAKQLHVEQRKEQLGRIIGVGDAVMQTGWVGSWSVLKHPEPFQAALL